jgi:hypothetical protein
VRALASNSFVLTFVLLLTFPAIGRSDTTTRAILPKTNLVIFLEQLKAKQPIPGTTFQLEPEWVGKMEQIYLHDPGGVYQKLPVDYADTSGDRIRFSHLLVRTNLNGATNVFLLRGRLTITGELGSYVGSETPAFISNLPSSKIISEARTLDTLRELFGPQHGLTDAWGGRNELNWTEGWTWFTVEERNRLRCMNVFAHVVSTNRGRPAVLRILTIKEGLFRPADPNSAQERVEFKTGAEIFDAAQATKAQEREKYPEPLRSLVEARETPDDPDLIAYLRALNTVRKNPSPELFRQLAEWIHEDTQEIRSMLEFLLLDAPIPDLRLEKWKKPQRRIAVRAVVDALPHVQTTSDLEHLVSFVLRAHGGGTLKLTVPEISAVVNIAGLNSGTFSTDSHIPKEHLNRVAKECQEALRKKYSDLR